MATIAATKARNKFKALFRVIDSAWFGTSNDSEQPPNLLNNESLLGVNAAGTGTVAMLKVNASDQVEAANAILPTGGVTPIAGSPNGIYGANFVPTAATTGTSTQGVANKQWISPVWIPANMTITGLAFLIGTTGGTDKVITALYNNAGTLVANSSTSASGVTVGTAANMQSVDFTTPYSAVGPARYWASVQVSGTTAFLRTIPANVSVANVGSKTNTSATPATSITAPTAFTADVGPIVALY